MLQVKTSDNAARIATLFQVFEHGMSSAIGQDAFKGRHYRSDARIIN